MPERIETDICVIGAGSGGLSVAAGAAQLGRPVVLIEAAHMGGDCLNFGCVPSKALLAAAKHATLLRSGEKFGIDAVAPAFQFAAVRDHVKGVIANIAPIDSVERYQALGVRVIRAEAQFTGPTEVSAGDYVISARRVVVATGSSPSVPPIEGLDSVPYFTNETIFDNGERPEHLIVIGGGPIGIEMSQAHRRLGSKVTVVEANTVMPRDDPELAAFVKTALRREGVHFMEDAKVNRVETVPDGIRVTVAAEDGTCHIEGTHLLVATGRTANVSNLGLENAGIEYDRGGIKVDNRLRTTNKKVFAVGDVAGGPQFTHVAGYHAGIVIRNALFRIPAKADHRLVPWVTYTDPELGYVGLKETQAREQHGEVRILRWPFAENDRAQAERRAEGLVKVIATKRGGILGAGVVGQNAGELLQPWIVAMASKAKIGTFANMIVPYPTRGEVNKRAAGTFYSGMLFSPRVRTLVKWLARLG